MKQPGYLSGLVMVAAMILAPVVRADSQSNGGTTVHSLDETKGAIRTKKARVPYESSLDGIQSDGFGVKLPDGFTKSFLIQQLAPGQDPALAVLVGAKAWPLRPHSYVAIVCLAETASGLTKDDDGSCENLTGNNNRRVWFGVFEKNGSGTPTLVARTPAPVDVPTRWDSTNIDKLMEMDEQDEQKSNAAIPEKWVLFDLAPYQIRPGDYAFGVRAGWFEGYAGGGADFDALYLFQINGKALRVVFAQPISFIKDIAGNWHPDRTRDHHIYGANNSLIVLPGQTDGFHDLQLREQAGKWRQTFKWSPAKQFYMATGSQR